LNKTTVDSTTLQALGYDEARELLELEFRSGAIYQYLHVPQAVYEGLLDAPSKGRFFNAAIRGRFEYAAVASSPSGQRAGGA